MGIIIRGKRYRWPNGIVPYSIHPQLPDHKRVHDAIAHWQEKTVIRFIPKRRHDHNSAVFVEEDDPEAHCTSPVGMRGGEQEIRLAKGCTVGSVIHEIGHAVGLFHEHQRPDRSTYVDIIEENIEENFRFAFKPCSKEIGLAIGDYDFGSIMHYSPTAFGIIEANGKRKVTIRPQYPPNPLIPNVKIGYPNQLSRGDINTIYFANVCPNAFRPSRLQIGDRALLDPNTSPNRVRESPGLKEDNFNDLWIYPREEIDVLDGPVYANVRKDDQYIWWFIRSKSTQVKGWTSEADSAGYWLVPVF